MYSPEDAIAAETKGTSAAYWAALKPDAPAVFDRFGTKSFARINAEANALVRLMRSHGVAAGEHIGFICSNRAEVMAVMAANLCGGYRLAPINWHLKAQEIAYIVEDADIRALFVETRFDEALEVSRQAPGIKLRVSIGGPANGHIAFDEAVVSQDQSNIDDPRLGSTMFYTSGTTGRPKGVYRESLNMLAPEGITLYDPATDVQLCAGPLYHGAGLTLDTRTAMAVGVPVVYLDKWDSLEALRLIQTHRVTHAHMVPIMFQRLLALPPEVRSGFDLSSLKYIIHGAAPCPPDVKRAIIDWFGPILTEYYAGTEGGAGFKIDSHEWLRKPGSVGKRPSVGPRVSILDDQGQPCPPGVPGKLYFQRPAANGFSYYKDPEKTAAAHQGDSFTLGDIGVFDDDDYLYLTGRGAECIISGGVNIYPQEIDNEILKHPAVADCATVGVPNTEWGEEIKAVLQLQDGLAPSPLLEQQIIALVRHNLAGFKVPKSFDYVDALPRNAAGKVERGKVRAPYWAGRAIQI